MMKFLLPALLAMSLLACAQAAENLTKPGVGREGRIFSLFQIVRFPNDACAGNSNRNGTCYTEQECTDKGGANQGSCASGYGVCCVFALNCGASSSENCTYFESGGSEVGDCRLQICKCDSNICQLRLDFNTFTISGPSTVTVASGKFNGVDITPETQCLTDTFSVTNPGGITPPSICGINTGEHMYVDADDSCNDLVFQLGAAGVGTGISARQWNIKITQYSCDYENLAPDGCTQYFFGATTGAIQTFNNQGGHHLAGQNQNICIRQEASQCRICYFTNAMADFSTSGMTALMGFGKQSSCCGYGAAGIVTKGYDCVNIPGALKSTMTSMFAQSNLCGDTLVTTGTSAGPKTVCTDRVPFQVRFLSDDFEFVNEAPLAQSGFLLQYAQTNNGCT